MRTTRHQFEILVDYMERNGDISKLKMNPVGKARMSKHWEELSHLLNNSRNANGVAVVRTAEQWRKVWSDFKTNIRKKAEKGRLPKMNKDYHKKTIEARTIAIMNNDKPTDTNTNSDAGDTDDTDVKCVAQVDVRKALNLLSDSDDDDLVISDDDREKELKIDFSIQNFSDQGYNLPDDEGFNSHEGYAEKNINADIATSKNVKKRKSKEQKIQDTDNESCSYDSKSKPSQQQSMTVAAHAITEGVINNPIYNKKLSYDHDNDNNYQNYLGNHSANFVNCRDITKPENNDFIDLVQNNEDADKCNETTSRNINGQKKLQKNDPLKEADDFVNNYNNNTMRKMEENDIDTHRSFISDSIQKDGSLRQLLLSKLQKKKLASQSLAFENDNLLHFNNALGSSCITDSTISVIPIHESNFIDENNLANTVASKETPTNNKRPSTDQPAKPIKRRRRKLYSILMDKEREDRKFERELTMIKFGIMREEIQLKTRGLFMFQKFLHLAEQFFLNNSVLK